MKELALQFQVPALVVKYSGSFQHYVVIGFAIYGRGRASQRIVCLVHSGENKFDYLQLDAAGEERARQIYERLYLNQFKEPSECVRQETAYDQNEDIHSEQSHHTNLSSESVDSLDGESDGESDEESDEESEQGMFEANEEGTRQASDHDSPVNISDVTVVSAAGTSQNSQSSFGDGYSFDPSVSSVPRQHKLCGGRVWFTNICTVPGHEYKILEPVKIRKFNPGRCVYVVALITYLNSYCFL